ncbi:nuclear transport factor 2 family protein [Fodinibius sediminis]|uniref:SnoaL-like domain-containing protein n=1 Tax=Fodinibius sediminis TaxID=1214077 RepID=A0A521CFX2_9BACT|nr:nuclear transport factor 2 family protein [Fodinibius sediminis]SMO58319.1 SnoaL-like domain-containing protein [Fodinibius sediminis]
MKHLAVTGLLIAGLAMGCTTDPTPESSPEAVAKVLDDWHQAAAVADFERYFSYFASDSAVFMGTDATERWTVEEFRSWAKPYFERGRAWNFTPTERYVYLSERGKTAWFDESLDTPNLGPVRGSGVLVRRGTSWRIAHYNLSIPIPNAIADTVVWQVRKALRETTASPRE